MSTTPPVTEDQRFIGLVWKCARQIDFLEGLKGEDDVPIPDEFLPRPWYIEQAAAARLRLAEVLEWSDGRAEEEAKADYERQLQIHLNMVDEQAGRRLHAEGLLPKAQDWTPPSAAHQGLKDIMIRSLTADIENNNWSFTPPRRFTGAKFRANEVREAQHTIESYEREVERARKRTAWVRALRENLAQPAAG